MIEHHLTDEMNPQKAAKVTEVLRGPRIFIDTERDYPGLHTPWLGRNEAGLIAGKRQALLLEGFQGRPDGAIVWRPNPDNPHIADIRNVSLNPELRSLGLGHAMLGVVLKELVRTGYDTATIDTKIYNEKMIKFLEGAGFSVTDILDLYESGTLDVCMQRNLALTV
jgi:ribosomal protein S18 acetylase RimI-like enzyme